MAGAAIDYSLSGGGFFYSSFTQVSAFNNFLPICGSGIYGNWAHLAPPALLPHRGRWIHVDIAYPAQAGFYFFQLGLGGPGAEILWQPTDGNGFPVDWSGPAWNNPFSIEFPSSLVVGQEICCRSMVFVGLGVATPINIFIFN